MALGIAAPLLKNISQLLASAQRSVKKLGDEIVKIAFCA
jgi:hypothetical protein